MAQTESPIVITTLAERPEYRERMYEFADAWPKFMHNDPIGNAFMGQVPIHFPDQCVVATENGELVAHGRSIPFVFPDENRTELPSGGWDRVLHWGFYDLRAGREPNVSSALEILIRPSHLGRGLSHQMLEAMRAAVKAKGHATLYAPVRPNGKTDPHQPMTQYVEQLRPDGLPEDPWLRVHVKAGGKIVQVAPRSMVIAGSLAEWRGRTRLPLHTPRAGGASQGPLPLPPHATPHHA